MLRITENQFDALTDAFRKRFVSETAAFLRARRPAWSQGRSDAEIRTHVEDTIRFAHDHDLYNAASLMRLALIRIDRDFDDAPDSYPRLLLRAGGWSEARRIANYDRARRTDCGLERVRLGLPARQSRRR